MQKVIPATGHQPLRIGGEFSSHQHSGLGLVENDFSFLKGSKKTESHVLSVSIQWIGYPCDIFHAISYRDQATGTRKKLGPIRQLASCRYFINRRCLLTTIMHRYELGIG